MELKNFRKKHPEFYELFGYLGYDMCNGGNPTYFRHIEEERQKNIRYSLHTLTEDDIDGLMTKSEKDGKDLLFEAVKDNSFIPDPNVFY